jgi:hypothetical protein
MRLELYRPITYVRNDGLEPFAFALGGGLELSDSEVLFCFEVDGPMADARLVAAGFELYDAEIHEEIALPAGHYVFAQERTLPGALPSADDVFAMADEIKSFALAKDLRPANKLYLRYLFEDGKQVTQLFLSILAISA